VTKFIQEGLARISKNAFAHVASLDMSFHKNSNSKAKVFAINRALRSMETGLRFFLGFFSGTLVETAFLSFAIGSSLGPLYLLNSSAMLYFYVKYTLNMEDRRWKIIKAKTEAEKSQEVYQAEAVQNIQTIKAF
jgi:ABC-type transport system involved in Fe-S cluster assembly fused permease/ATPase subunit